MTISKATESVIRSSPFIEEALSDALINVSALSRKIKPQIESLVGKEVKEAAIIMAVNRLEPSYYYKAQKGIKSFLNNLGDFTVKSGINNYTFSNSETFYVSQANYLKEIAQQTNAFLSISNGVKECTIVASSTLHDSTLSYFSSERLIAHSINLATLTIDLPKENTEISGVYYFILKKLAWLGINILEVISTTNEITFLIAENDIEKAFSALLNLKRDDTM